MSSSTTSWTPQPAGTHLCTNAEMTDFQFGMPASGGAGTQKFTLPGNLAVKVPKGGADRRRPPLSERERDGRAGGAVGDRRLLRGPERGRTRRPGTMVVLDTELTVPVGASTYTEDCTINQAYEAVVSDARTCTTWGAHITITDTPVSTGAPQKLVRSWTGTPDYAFDFSTVAIAEAPVDAVCVQRRATRSTSSATTNNTTGAPMTFGDEMCVLATFTVDPNNVGNVECDRGQWGLF